MIIDEKELCFLLKRLFEKDSNTFEHSLRMMKIAENFGKHLKLDHIKLEGLKYAALLHDVGKIDVPTKILKKPSCLTGKEMDIVKEHPLNGYSRLRLFTEAESLLQGVLQHHERPDGKGYPEGIPKDKIHDYAKIISILDAYDTMTHDRPYSRSVKTGLKAINEIQNHRGTQFDPLFADEFWAFIYGIND